MLLESRFHSALWLSCGLLLPACAVPDSELIQEEPVGASGFPPSVPSAAGGSVQGSGGANAGGILATGGSNGPLGTGGGPGAGGAAPSAGGAGTGGHGSGGGPAIGEGGAPEAGGSKPPCLSRPSQMVLIGDSYITWVSHTFPTDLNREAGQTFRNYAIGAYAMGSGGIGLISSQFDRAIAEDPDIVAAVMDGGGNDVLVPAPEYPQGGLCKNQLDSPTLLDCQDIVQTAMDAAGVLIGRAADAGIRDVVYFFYPHVPEGTLVGGLHPNAILDYALPKVRALCEGARAQTGGRLTCHFLDLIPVFANHPDYFAPTDIHPNPAGSAAMARAVWQLMKDECIAQPASSGCCNP